MNPYELMIRPMVNKLSAENCFILVKFIMNTVYQEEIKDKNHFTPEDWNRDLMIKVHMDLLNSNNNPMENYSASHRFFNECAIRMKDKAMCAKDAKVYPKVYAFDTLAMGNYTFTFKNYESDQLWNIKYNTMATCLLAGASRKKFQNIVVNKIKELL